MLLQQGEIRFVLSALHQNLPSFLHAIATKLDSLFNIVSAFISALEFVGKKMQLAS